MSYARAPGAKTNFAAGEHRQRTGNRAVRPNRDPISRAIARGEVTRPARRLDDWRVAGAVGRAGGAVGYGSAQRDVAQLG